MARPAWPGGERPLEEEPDRPSEPDLGLETWTIIRLSLIGLLLALGILLSLLWT